MSHSCGLNWISFVFVVPFLCQTNVTSSICVFAYVTKNNFNGTQPKHSPLACAFLILDKD